MKTTLNIILAFAFCIGSTFSNVTNQHHDAHNELLTPSGSLQFGAQSGHGHPLDALNTEVGPFSLPGAPIGSGGLLSGPVGLGLTVATQDPECTNYRPFLDTFVCPTKKLKYDIDLIHHEICNGQRGSYSGIYQEDIDSCYKQNMEKPLPIQPPPPMRNRTIVYSQLCEAVQVPIYHLNVYNELTGRTDQCSIVNCGNLRQTVNYTMCVNPIAKDNDMCQLDYTTRTEYRCVQAGFININVLVYCPGSPSTDPTLGVYKNVEHKIPTACSCKKCFHCASNMPSQLAELSSLAELGFESFF